ncbi:MAG: IclR family transcriptional regulator [Bacillota bacterium]
MKKKTNGVQSVDRAISILDQLEKSSVPLGVTEISKRLDLHKSTVFGLLSTLENRGFVSQCQESGKYKLGLRLFELGRRVQENMDLRAQVNPYLKSLVERFQETAHLVVKNNNDVVYIDKVDGPQAIRMYSQIGRSTPIHCTGVGKALLAFLPESEQEKILESIELHPFTHKTITDKDVLKKELSEIKKRGYSIDDEEIEIGLRCIGVPILDHNGIAVASISIAGPTTRMTNEKVNMIIEPLKEAAMCISETLGFKPSIK